MKKFLIVCTVLLAAVGVAQADFTWSFTAGTNTVQGALGEDTMGWALDTGAGTVAVTGPSTQFDSEVALSGTGSQNANFTMTIEAGFGFDATAPTYDTTDYAGPEGQTNNNFKIRGDEGIAPNGFGVGFGGGDKDIVGDAEVMTFTISGLAAGQSFQLTGYAMKPHSKGHEARNDLYYGPTLTFYDTLGTPEDVSGLNILLGNGDQFAFGYALDAGKRVPLESISFDIIPEPGTVALFGAGLIGLLARRRRMR